MTTEERKRNERIATEVMGWEKNHCSNTDPDYFVWEDENGPCLDAEGEIIESVPNFISDDSTMAMIVEGLLKQGIYVRFQDYVLRAWCELSKAAGPDQEPVWLTASKGDTPHAALIAAVEEMIEEQDAQERIAYAEEQEAEADAVVKEYEALESKESPDAE